MLHTRAFPTDCIAQIRQELQQRNEAAESRASEPASPTRPASGDESILSPRDSLKPNRPESPNRASSSRRVRAALCHSAETARMARQHNDANVLVLGGRVLDPDTARECLRVFLDTAFLGGRHEPRVAKLA